MKKVSLIIPYNKDRGWLDLAIKSVEQQTYKNIELIIEQSDNGVSYNLNRAIEKATGDYIKYLCEDDELTLNSITDSVKAMDGFDFIHADSEIMQQSGQVTIQKPRYYRPTLAQMLDVNVIHGGTLMYSADIFWDGFFFDETLTTGEEYDFNLNLLALDFRLGYTPSTVYKYRMHQNQKSRRMQIADRKGRKAKIEMIKDRYR